MVQKKQPVRMCSGCAEHRPKKELVRVVRTPEGEILLDPTGKKSGRGAYLCQNPDCLKRRARRAGSSARSTVKSPTRCTSASSEKWGNLRMNDKLLSALSLCRKAGRLKMGGDVVREEIMKGGAGWCCSRRTRPNARCARCGSRAKEGKVPLRMIPRTMDELWATAGKRYGVFAVCDGGFAKMIAGLLPPEGAETAEQ